MTLPVILSVIILKPRLVLPKIHSPCRKDISCICRTGKKVNDNVTFGSMQYLLPVCSMIRILASIPISKVISKKLAYQVPLIRNLKVCPFRIYLPFGFYPLTQGRHSGFLPPQFATNEQFGFGSGRIGLLSCIK